MTFKRQMLYAMLSASLLTLMLSCAPQTQTGEIDGGHANFCQIAKPISYSRLDTAQTRMEIAAHNCVGHSLCGWPVQSLSCHGP